MFRRFQLTVHVQIFLFFVPTAVVETESSFLNRTGILSRYKVDLVAVVCFVLCPRSKITLLVSVRWMKCKNCQLQRPGWQFSTCWPADPTEKLNSNTTLWGHWGHSQIRSLSAWSSFKHQQDVENLSEVKATCTVQEVERHQPNLIQLLSRWTALTDGAFGNDGEFGGVCSGEQPYWSGPLLSDLGLEMNCVTKVPVVQSSEDRWGKCWSVRAIVWLRNTLTEIRRRDNIFILTWLLTF